MGTPLLATFEHNTGLLRSSRIARRAAAYIYPRAGENVLRYTVSVRLAAGVVAFGVWSAGFGANEAKAHRRDFPNTYDWHQPAKGAKEIEFHTRYRGRNNSLRQQVEFEYGITDRWMVAPYLVFQKGSGGGLDLTGYKLQTRYQLGEYKANTWLPGLYAEYIGNKNAPDVAEGKLILSRFGKKGDNFSFNYIVERALTNGAAFENQYSMGYARSLGSKGFAAKRDLRGGVEWIHNLSSGRINAGPVLGFSPSKRTWIVGGWALPVNSRGGNKSEFRLLAEYEF